MQNLVILAIVFADKILINFIYYHASDKCGIYLGKLFFSFYLGFKSSCIFNLGLLVRMFHTGAYPLIRSLAVSYVSKENVGKILGLLLITETIGENIKRQLYTTKVWDAIYETNRGVFLTIAFILLPPTICALM